MKSLYIHEVEHVKITSYSLAERIIFKVENILEFRV